MMSRNTGAAHLPVTPRRSGLRSGGVEGGNRDARLGRPFGQDRAVPLPPASYLYPRISPDGRLMAVEIEGPSHDFYFYDFARTVFSKVSTDGMSHDPVWSRTASVAPSGPGSRRHDDVADAGRSKCAPRHDWIQRTSVRVPVCSRPMESFSRLIRRIAQTRDDVWSCRSAASRSPLPWRSRDSGRVRQILAGRTLDRGLVSSRAGRRSRCRLSPGLDRSCRFPTPGAPTRCGVGRAESSTTAEATR